MAKEGPPAVQPTVPKIPIMLTSQQESQVRDIYHARVRAKCSDEIRKFAECVKDHMFTANFTCSDEKLGMNQCLRHYGTRAEEDRAREEWFLNIDERRKQRELNALAHKENEKLLKEWWGMDENWNRIREPQKQEKAKLETGRSASGKGG